MRFLLIALLAAISYAQTENPCVDDQDWTNNRGLNCDDMYAKYIDNGKDSCTASVESSCCDMCRRLALGPTTTEEMKYSTVEPLETDAPTEEILETASTTEAILETEFTTEGIIDKPISCTAEGWGFEWVSIDDYHPDTLSCSSELCLPSCAVGILGNGIQTCEDVTTLVGECGQEDINIIFTYALCVSTHLPEDVPQTCSVFDNAINLYQDESGVCDQSEFYEYIENSIEDPVLQEWCRIAAAEDGDYESVCGCLNGIDQEWFSNYGDCLWEANDEETLLEQSNFYCSIEPLDCDVCEGTMNEAAVFTNKCIVPSFHGTCEGFGLIGGETFYLEDDMCEATGPGITSEMCAQFGSDAAEFEEQTCGSIYENYMLWMSANSMTCDANLSGSMVTIADVFLAQGCCGSSDSTTVQPSTGDCPEVWDWSTDVWTSECGCATAYNGCRICQNESFCASCYDGYVMHPNGYCVADGDTTVQPTTIQPTSPSEPTLPACVGNANTFYTGYGMCGSYAPGASNSYYCTSDYDQSQGFYPYQVCEECQQCQISSVSTSTTSPYYYTTTAISTTEGVCESWCAVYFASDFYTEDDTCEGAYSAWCGGCDECQNDQESTTPSPSGCVDYACASCPPFSYLTQYYDNSGCVNYCTCTPFEQEESSMDESSMESSCEYMDDEYMLQMMGVDATSCQEAMSAGLCLEHDQYKGNTGVWNACPVSCGLCDCPNTNGVQYVFPNDYYANLACTTMDGDHYCSVDPDNQPWPMDNCDDLDTTDTTAQPTSPSEPTLPACVGNADFFQAGYGGCDTYAPGASNYNYCSGDYDQAQGFYSYQVCQECQQCEGTSISTSTPYYYTTTAADCPSECILSWISDGYCDDGVEYGFDCTPCPSFTDASGVFDGGDCDSEADCDACTADFFANDLCRCLYEECGHIMLPQSCGGGAACEDEVTRACGGEESSSMGEEEDEVPSYAVLCPGFEAAQYCDCGGDCSAQPAWCSCAEAQQCCGMVEESSMDVEESSMDEEDDCPSLCTRSWVGDGWCDNGIEYETDCTPCDHFTDSQGLFDGGDCERVEESSMDDGNSTEEPTTIYGCIEDAMMCPDGSYVGRDIANNCEFYPCPTAEAEVCGYSCDDVVFNFGIDCSTTWEVGCNGVEPPNGFTGSSTLYEFCPTQCGPEPEETTASPSECITAVCDCGPDYYSVPFYNDDGCEVYCECVPNPEESSMEEENDCPAMCTRSWVGDGYCDNGIVYDTDCTPCEHFTDSTGVFDGGDCDIGICSSMTMYGPTCGGFEDCSGPFSSLWNHACSNNGDISDCCGYSSAHGGCMVMFNGMYAYPCYEDEVEESSMDDGKSTDEPTTIYACAEDAMMCSDGSYVGRDIENNCEFFPCPTEDPTTTAEPTTSTTTAEPSQEPTPKPITTTTEQEIDSTEMPTYDAPDAGLLDSMGSLLVREATEARFTKVGRRAGNILQQKKEGDVLHPDVRSAMSAIKRISKQEFTENRWDKMVRYYEEVREMGY